MSLQNRCRFYEKALKLKRHLEQISVILIAVLIIKRRRKTEENTKTFRVILRLHCEQRYLHWPPDRISKSAAIVEVQVPTTNVYTNAFSTRHHRDR